MKNDKNRYFPSIWLASFENKREFDDLAPQLRQVSDVADYIDDRMLTSRHAFTMGAYCVACKATAPMSVAWHWGAANAQGSIHPAWTETCVCAQCGLNSRMRALIDYLYKINSKKSDRIYIAERLAPSYPVIANHFDEVIGSEYLGPEMTKGQQSSLTRDGVKIRIQHEDLTDLSFANAAFDLVITQDVFEHIPDYKKSFSECARVLKPGASLVFTIPFFPEMQITRVRATLDGNGSIVHHLPPEFHGNPVSEGGSLCFQNFGWDILSSLREAGFRSATSHLYWGPWQGHLGTSFFVFSAQT